MKFEEHCRIPIVSAICHFPTAVLLMIYLQVSVTFGIQDDAAATAQPLDSAGSAPDAGNGTKVENTVVHTERSEISGQPGDMNADNRPSPPYQAMPYMREPPYQPSSRPYQLSNSYGRGINYLNETVFPDGADDLTPYSRLRGPETRGPNSDFQYQDPRYFSAPLYSQQSPVRVPTYSAPLYPRPTYTEPHIQSRYTEPIYRAPYQLATRPLPYQEPYARYDHAPMDSSRYGPPPNGPHTPTVGYNTEPYRVPYRNYTASSSFNLKPPIRRPYGTVNYPASDDAYDRPYYLRPDHDPYDPVYFDDLDWDDEDDEYGEFPLGYRGPRRQRSGRRGFSDTYDDRYRRGYRYRKNRKYRDDDFEPYSGRYQPPRHPRQEYEDDDDGDRYFSYQNSRRSKNSRYDKDIRYDKNYRYDKDYDFDYSKDSYDATTDFDNRFNPKIVINNHYESYSDNDEYRDNTYSQSSYDSRNRKDRYSSSATRNDDRETYEYIAPSSHYYLTRRIPEAEYLEPVSATKPPYSNENRYFSPNTSYLLPPVSALQRTNSYRTQPGLHRRVLTNETYGNRTLYRGDAKRSATAIKDPSYNETAETYYPESSSLDGGRNEKYARTGESVYEAPRHQSAFAPDYRQTVENNFDATGAYAGLPNGSLRESNAQNAPYLRPGHHGDYGGNAPGQYPRRYRFNTTLAYGRRMTFGEEYGNNSKGGYNSYKPYMVRLNRAPYTKPENPQNPSHESSSSTGYDPYLANPPYRKWRPDHQHNVGQNQTDSNSDLTYRKLKRVKNQKPVEDIPYPESAAVNPEHIGDTWEGKMTSGKSSEEEKS